MMLTGGMGERVFTSGVAAIGSISTASELALTSGALAASVMAVSKLVSCVGVGYLAANKGVLDPPSCSTLSKLVYAVLQPALLFVHVSSTLASPTEQLSNLILMPAMAVVHIGLGAIMGSAVVRMLRLNPDTVDGREMKMASAFANAGPLPFLFVDALFRSSVDLQPRAIALISFYLLGCHPCFWTLGRNMLAPSPTREEGTDLGHSHSTGAAVKKGLVSATKQMLSPPIVACFLGAMVGGIPFLQQAFLGSSAPLRPLMDALNLLAQAYLPCVILTLAGTLHQSLTGGPQDRMDSSIRRVAGSGKDAQDVDSAAQPRSGATTTLWTPRLTSAKTLTRAPDVLASPATSAPPSPLHMTKMRQHVGLATKVWALSVVRFVAMPLLGLLLVGLGTRCGIIPRDDPLLRFVLLMQACMPCTQNSLVILHLDKNSGGAQSMAKTISAQYIAAVLPMPVLLSFCRMAAGL